MASSKQHCRILEVSNETLTIYITLNESMLYMDEKQIDDIILMQAHEALEHAGKVRIINDK